MLTYRTGMGESRSAGAAMADHLLEQTLSPVQAELARYYQRGLDAPTPGATVAETRRDLDPRLAALLGLDPGRTPSRDEIAWLLTGSRIDGQPIPGKQTQAATQSLADQLGLDPGRVPTAAEIDQVLAGRRADGGELDGKAVGARQRLLEQYGVAPDRHASNDELDRIRAGQHADGTPLRAAEFARALAAAKSRVAYVDLCWSADKTTSVAWAFAPTEAERNIIAQAHRDAVATTLLYVEAEIGRARKGKAGRGGFDPGRLAWVAFDHYTSRPTAEVPRTDPESGEAYTQLVPLRVAGDPQLHTHVAIPNVVLTEDGRVGGLDLQRLEGRVHEFGALYQAHLAENLRRHGVEVGLDPASGSARLAAIPAPVRDAFSKRTRNGTDAAREYARAQGLDWDQLDPERRIGLAKQGVQGDPRQAKQDDLGDFAAWQRQAEALGWRHRSVLRPGAVGPMRPREDRLDHAYQEALGPLDIRLQRRALVEEADLRVAAARGLVVAGIEEARDVDAVLQLFAERGVMQDGRPVGLILGAAEDDRGRSRRRVTTTLHVEQETELVELARAAARDRATALASEAIAASVARSPFDFAGSEHGRIQRAVMDRLGQAGRLAVAIGVAGSGKSTLLAPLVEAWTADGRVVHGTALAWRQSGDLAGAGIPQERLLALAALLKRASDGKLALGRDDVVVMDELGLVGTRQLLELLRLQRRHGFQLVAVGDQRQCQSIEAGPVIGLLRRALGPETVPELLSTVRQVTGRERETALMFREGRAAEALARKREDGTVELVPGGHGEAVRRVAALWQERRQANAGDPGYTLTVSAPTNSDAREIAAAIRGYRRNDGELGPDERILDACDQAGVEFRLTLAVGDRVRLFDRVNAACLDGSRGIIGNNGSVLEVRGIAAAGLTLRNAQGREGLVKWNTLRDEASLRIRLTYGDVLSIDATQGLTSTEHIEAMPGGSRTVNAYKGYVAASRHRRTSFLVTSDGAERREIAGRRPLGDARPIREADVWENVARNLARAPEKASALEFLEAAHDLRRGAVRAMQEGLQRGEQRALEGGSANLGQAFRKQRAVAGITQAGQQLSVALRQRGELLERLQVAMEDVQAGQDAPVPAPAPDAGKATLGRAFRRWRVAGDLVEAAKTLSAITRQRGAVLKLLRVAMDEARTTSTEPAPAPATLGRAFRRRHVTTAVAEAARELSAIIRKRGRTLEELATTVEAVRVVPAGVLGPVPHVIAGTLGRIFRRRRIAASLMEAAKQAWVLSRRRSEALARMQAAISALVPVPGQPGQDIDASAGVSLGRAFRKRRMTTRLMKVSQLLAVQARSRNMRLQELTAAIEGIPRTVVRQDVLVCLEEIQPAGQHPDLMSVVTFAANVRRAISHHERLAASGGGRAHEIRDPTMAALVAVAPACRVTSRSGQTLSGWEAMQLYQEGQQDRARLRMEFSRTEIGEIFAFLPSRQRSVHLDELRVLLPKQAKEQRNTGLVRSRTSIAKSREKAKQPRGNER